MTVESKEIFELQKYVLRQIEKIKSSQNPDNAKLFDLNILDSNLSLLVSSLEQSSENEALSKQEIELGTRDTQIKNALLEFRKTKKFNSSFENISFQYSQVSSQIIEELNNLIENLKLYENQEESKILSENLKARFQEAKDVLSEVSNLPNLTKKNQKLWKTEKIPLSVKSAASTLGSVKSEKKSLSSQKNGKKGGRPKSSGDEAKSSREKTDTSRGKTKSSSGKSQSSGGKVKSSSKNLARKKTDA